MKGLQKWQFAAVMLLFSSAPLHASALNGEKPLSIAAAVAEVVTANPGLAAISARAEALAALPDQLGTLPDPQLSFKLINLPIDSFSFSQEGMTQTQVGFSQMLPFPGKLGLRQEAAEAMATAAGFGVEELRLKLIRDVKMVWWNLFFLDRALEVVENNQMLMRQFIEVAESKYSVGKGLQQDVLLAQLELSKLFDHQVDLEGQRRNESIRLSTLLDRPTTALLVLPNEVAEDFPTLRDEAQLMVLAAEARPLLAAREQRLEAARLRVELAEKNYYPDFSVGAAYGLRLGDNPNGSSRDDLVSLMFGMSLPIYTATRQDRAVDQRNAERMGQRYALADDHNRVEATIGRALSDYQRGREKVDLFKTGIIPQAQQTVASMLAGYQVNKVDFLNVMRAQITLYNYETQYWNAFSRARQAIARLAAAVGEEAIYE
ncbi:MAG TPA: TolC family protein [Chromatiales bacterium]|nr:TolC family protein [Chromatiales bacterium]HEX22679.1 TolC family protein [Chromatiales bacterium]